MKTFGGISGNIAEFGVGRLLGSSSRKFERHAFAGAKDATDVHLIGPYTLGTRWAFLSFSSFVHLLATLQKQTSLRLARVSSGHDWRTGPDRTNRKGAT